MADARKVIITCAVTGSVHTPTMSPYLPITPDQIAEGAIAAAEAGAAILHLHARDPRDGRPTPDPAVFMEFLPRIHAATDAVINITTGGSTQMTLDERLAAPLSVQPEMCSLNMGSMNFGLFHMAGKRTHWQYDWEPTYLENTRDTIFKNTFKDIEDILRRLGDGCGTRFEFECYDVGHLYTLAHFLERGLVKPPLFVQTIFGILGGIGPDVENLQHMRTIADKLFGRDYEWSILGAGRHQMNLITIGATMGGHVRVGLEDSLYLGKGELARTNAAQVAKIRGIVEALSLEVAPPPRPAGCLPSKGRTRSRFSRGGVAEAASVYTRSVAMRSAGRAVLEEEPRPTAPAGSLVDRLRAAIVLGTIAPGERLVQAELAAQYGVSRIPLREALHALHGEGLVVIEPNRGTICRPLEPRDLADLYTLRIALEQLAMTAAAERFVDLRTATEAMGAQALAAHDAGDLNRMIALDRDFHAALAEGAGNVHLAGALGTCWSQIMRGMHFYFTLDVYPPDVWSEHVAIAQAVAHGDTDDAVALATAHIGTSRTAILEALRGKKR